MLTEILIYNNYTNKIERFLRKEEQAMPYSTGGRLKVKEFRACSNSSVLWTDIRTLKAWDDFSLFCKADIKPDKAFMRIWEGSGKEQSMHFTGMEFDIDSGMDQHEKDNICRDSGRLKSWSRVRRDECKTGAIHMDKHMASIGAACGDGFPLLRKGAVGTYVLMLQDALAALGFNECGLNGCFDDAVKRALEEYQSSRGLYADGKASQLTWNMISCEANGAGHTNTVIKP